jgi:5-methylcytosine-specific restriction endonuclease McrA
MFTNDRVEPDDDRMSPAPRGERRRWQAFRPVFLRKNPLCFQCLKDDGRRTPATRVVHTDPRCLDPAKFWAGPFQSLCDECRRKRWGTAPFP